MLESDDIDTSTPRTREGKRLKRAREELKGVSTYYACSVSTVHDWLTSFKDCQSQLISLTFSQSMNLGISSPEFTLESTFYDYRSERK